MRVHPVVERLAAYAWRLIGIVAVLVGLLWLIGQLWVLLLALVVGAFLTRALDTPATWLRGRGARPALAALLSLILLLGSLALIGWFVAPAVADEFESLGPTLTEALDDVERWLVEDAPFDIDQSEIDEFRSELRTTVTDAVSSSGGEILSGAVVAFEVLTGLLLALVSTFFFLKDGERLQGWFLERLPGERRPLARRLGRRAWQTLGSYLRGVVILGALEATVIGITLAIVGSELVLPVVVLTFLAAFIPIVGAVVAGFVAVLVALATTGFGGAVIVALVALAVQQLDNDLLAPVIYGRALQLHPLVVLFAVVGGGALFGFAGTVLGVPVTALVVNLLGEVRRPDDEGDAARPAPSPA